MLDGWTQVIFAIAFFGVLGISLILDLPDAFGRGDSRDPWLDDDM